MISLYPSAWGKKNIPFHTEQSITRSMEENVDEFTERLTPFVNAISACAEFSVLSFRILAYFNLACASALGDIFRNCNRVRLPVLWPNIKQHTLIAVSRQPMQSDMYSKYRPLD